MRWPVTCCVFKQFICVKVLLSCVHFCVRLSVSLYLSGRECRGKQQQQQQQSLKCVLQLLVSHCANYIYM